MNIGDIIKITIPGIQGEHRIVILYEKDMSVAFVVMTSQIQKQTAYLKQIGHSEKYIQKTLVTVAAHEYQSKKNHAECSLTCETAINTNNIKFYNPDILKNKTPCDTISNTLLKKICDGIQASDSIDEETKNSIQQEYNNHHTPSQNR